MTVFFIALLALLFPRPPFLSDDNEDDHLFLGSDHDDLLLPSELLPQQTVRSVDELDPTLLPEADLPPPDADSGQQKAQVNTNQVDGRRPEEDPAGRHRGPEGVPGRPGEDQESGNPQSELESQGRLQNNAIRSRLRPTPYPDHLVPYLEGTHRDGPNQPIFSYPTTKNDSSELPSTRVSDENEHLSTEHVLQSTEGVTGPPDHPTPTEVPVPAGRDPGGGQQDPDAETEVPESETTTEVPETTTEEPGRETTTVTLEPEPEVWQGEERQDLDQGQEDEGQGRHGEDHRDVGGHGRDDHTRRDDWDATTAPIYVDREPMTNQQSQDTPVPESDSAGNTTEADMGGSTSKDGSQGSGSTYNDRSSGFQVLSLHGGTAIATCIVILIVLSVVACLLRIIMKWASSFSDRRRNRRLDNALDRHERAYRDQRTAFLRSPQIVQNSPQIVPLENLNTSSPNAPAIVGPEGRIV